MEPTETIDNSPLNQLTGGGDSWNHTSASLRRSVWRWPALRGFTGSDCCCLVEFLRNERAELSFPVCSAPSPRASVVSLLCPKAERLLGLVPVVLRE